jgi:hypothetical protein
MYLIHTLKFKKMTKIYLILTIIIWQENALAQLAFTSFSTYSTGTTSRQIVSADFNNDGKSDLAVCNSISNNVSVLLASSNGSFTTAVNYSVGTSPLSLSAADFNSDGHQDLAVVNRLSSNVSILLGSSNGTLTFAANYATGG